MAPESKWMRGEQMDRIQTVREEIYDYFHTQSSKITRGLGERRFAAYYTCMHLIKDASESLGVHRKSGFSKDPFVAYIEFWGIMQAIIVLQDVIFELYWVVTGGKLEANHYPARAELRELRNLCAGHPARREHKLPLAMAFMARGFGRYDQISYEKWEEGVGTTFPKVNLGDFIDKYIVEACEQLANIFAEMKSRWPSPKK